MEVDSIELKRLREEQVLSLRELEEESGVHRNTIYAIENGQRKRNHPATIRKLAKALGVTPGQLLRQDRRN